MTDWAAISAAGFAPPTGRALGDLVDELTEALASPDPDAGGTLVPPHRDAMLPALAGALHLAFPPQA